MKLPWLSNNVKSSFKNILTEALEVNVGYKGEF